MKVLLRDFLLTHAEQVRVLCYVRRPDEHIVSMYQQRVRAGYLGSIGDWVDDRIWTERYRSFAILRDWEDVFGAGTVEARLFHGTTLKGGPILDFLDWIGVDAGALSLDPLPRRRMNESFDPVGTEILRLLHAIQGDMPDVLADRDITEFKRRLLAVNTPERLRLGTAQALRLQDAFRDDYEQLAARYLRPEEAVALLARPAETEATRHPDSAAILGRLLEILDDQDFAGFLGRRAAQREAARLAKLSASPTC